MWKLNNTLNNQIDTRNIGIPLLNMKKEIGILLNSNITNLNNSSLDSEIDIITVAVDNSNGISYINKSNTLINTFTVNISNLLINKNYSESPDTLVINNTTFTRIATDKPTDLTANTFFYNPITKEITLATAPNSKQEVALKLGLRITINIKKQRIDTDYLQPIVLPGILRGLPLRGNIQVNLGFEQHPAGSLELVTDYRYIDTFRKIFIGGAELTFFNIGFRVNSVSIKPDPRSTVSNMEYIVSVSLGGKWENYIDKEVNIKNSVTSKLGPGYVQEVEEELCRNIGKNTINRSNYKLPVSLLASQVGANICGLAAYIEIEKDTPLDTWVNWFSVFQEHLRINKSFMILSNPDCVQAKGLNAIKTFSFKDDIVLAYEGTSINSKLKRNFPTYTSLTSEPLKLSNSLPSYIQPEPEITTYKAENINLIPYGAEYQNTSLDGKFRNPLPNKDDEETQNNKFKEQKPYWRRRPPERITTRVGDLYPTLPPPYTSAQTEGYDLSLNWDSSGPTKVIKVSITENGSPMSEEVYTYGFSYTAAQITGIDKEGSPIAKKPLFVTWGLVQEEITEHFYDNATGYYLGCETNGWAIRRYRQENTTEPETVLYAYERLRIAVELKDGVKYSRKEEDNSIITTPLTDKQREEYAIEDKYYSALIEACLPRQLKSISKTMLSLEPFHKYYLDTKLGGYETYQTCLPNGKLGYGIVEDPSWTPPYFLAYEYRETNSFSKMSNPENILIKWEFDKTIANRLPTEPQEYKPLPPLTVGEESHFVQQTIVYPKEKQQWSDFGSLLYGSSKEAKVDRYTKYSNEYSGQDSQFYASLHNTKFEECIGRPSEASKKDLGWEKVEPQQTEENPPDLTSGTSAVALNNSFPAIPVANSNCSNKIATEPIIYEDGLYSTSDNKELANHKLNRNDYDYFMATPGVDVYKDSPQGSQSYNYAQTLQQAVNGAQTDLYIANVQNTLTTTFTIPLNLKIREFDKIELVINGEIMTRRVLSINHNIDIQGVLNNIPFTTGTTTITCGLDRCVGFTVYKKRKPESINSNDSNQSSNKNNPQTLTRFIILDNKPIEMGDLVKVEIARRTHFDF